jgi:hypothetical protein
MNLQRVAVRLNQPTERQLVAGLGRRQELAPVRVVGEIHVHGLQ